MASMTLTQRKSLLRDYIAAERAVLLGQSYTIKDRALTRADLKWIQQGRKELEKEINQLEAGGSIRTKRILFRDN